MMNTELDARTRRKMTFIAMIVALGGLLFGYNTGVTNGAISFMKLPSELDLTPFTEGAVVSVLTLGAAIGAIFGGTLSDRFGRKTVISYLAAIFLIFSVLCTLAPNVLSMILFRFALGLAVGGASVTVPTYLAEISTVEMRGKIVTVNELMVVSGQFLAFVVSAILGTIFAEYSSIWRYILLVAALPAAGLIIGLFRIPESPRWLFHHKGPQSTLAALNKIRPQHIAQAEIDSLGNIPIPSREPKQAFSVKELWSPPFRRLLLVGMCLGGISQLIGINVIMYYGTTILGEAGFGSTASLYANTANGLISVLAVVVGMNLMHRVDRRKMLIVGIVGTLVSMFAITSLLWTMMGSPILPYLVIGLTVVFIAFFQGCIGPIVFLLLSEMFPQKLRGFGVGLSTFALWMCNFVVSFVFPLLLSGIGLAHTFLIFTLFNAVGLLFAIKCVPETRGRSLEQIERELHAPLSKQPVTE
ncbi:sugar porter family MFS transporter [Paenibacillus sp. WLX2291]|uniref:sugar porter family MFS transporter n=1 Tax=Paenibacillus sp. WLX2291 TaxID=3296934 RepID=UPI0039845611